MVVRSKSTHAPDKRTARWKYQAQPSHYTDFQVCPCLYNKYPSRRIQERNLPRVCRYVSRSNPLATADGLDLEPDLAELVGIDKETAVKDERGLVHAGVHLLPVDIAELFPLGGDDDCLGALARLECGWADLHLLFD